jgi:hypothetical protein
VIITYLDMRDFILADPEIKLNNSTKQL